MTNDCKTCPVSTGTHKPAEAVHQIAEPAASMKQIDEAIDALVMAAFTEGGCSEHRMSEARIQTELRKKELRTLLSTPQPCSRSHPHEEMTPMCELRTEIARLTNALARTEAQLAAAPQAVQAAEEMRVCNNDECGWIGPLSETYGYKHSPATLCPECKETTELAAPSVGMNDEGYLPCPFCGSHEVSLSIGEKGDGTPWHYVECESCAATSEPEKWNDRAPAHPAEGVPAQAIRDAVIQHLTSAGVLEHDGCGIFIASGNASELIDACVILAATQPAAQGVDVPPSEPMYYLQDARWSSMVGNCPSFWREGGNGYTTNLDEAGRFTHEEAMAQHRSRSTDLPWLCSEVDKLRRPTVDFQNMPRSWDAQRAALAAQAKQGEQA